MARNAGARAAVYGTMVYGLGAAAAGVEEALSAAGGGGAGVAASGGAGGVTGSSAAAAAAAAAVSTAAMMMRLLREALQLLLHCNEAQLLQWHLVVQGTQSVTATRRALVPRGTSPSRSHTSSTQ